MLVEKRQQMILKMLEEKKSVTVTEIKDALGISESTIRRDLTVLDSEGQLVKVFGGAIAINSNYNAKELSVSQKLRVNEEEKRRIAKNAAAMIEPTDFKTERCNIRYKCSCTCQKVSRIRFSCNTCRWRIERNNRSCCWK